MPLRTLEMKRASARRWGTAWMVVREAYKFEGAFAPAICKIFFGPCPTGAGSAYGAAPYGRETPHFFDAAQFTNSDAHNLKLACCFKSQLYIREQK